MDKGVSLVELVVALACSSVLVLALYHVHRVSASSHHEMRDAWHCMQSIRQATLQLNSDMTQAACLLPQDMGIRVEGSDLYIAGIPVTSQHPGIALSTRMPPPYYAVVLSSGAFGFTLDTTDIDGDARDDFWADLGVITDRGPCTISHGYTRGNVTLSISAGLAPLPGDRVVPAVHYGLEADGLYRNGQLLAEAVVLFDPAVSGRELTIRMRSRYHGSTKDILLSYPVEVE